MKAMDLAQVQADYSIPGVLAFDEPQPGMIRARVASPACTAELYLHGAHLTAWQPTDEEPVLFLSEHSAFAPGKAIRGGIPVIAPWFGAPKDSPLFAERGVPEGAASHGWARTATWQLYFAAMVGDEVRLSLALPVDETQNARFGFPGLRLAYDVILGRTLTVRLTATNADPQPLRFEEALHSYFHVGDAREVTIRGLGGVEYLDKTDGFKRKLQDEAPMALAGETDRAYIGTDSTVTLSDPALERRIVVAKSGSNTTVVWNPWDVLTATMKDLELEDWKHFACIETANAADNIVTLGQQEVHTMEARISVERV